MLVNPKPTWTISNLLADILVQVPDVEMHVLFVEEEEIYAGKNIYSFVFVGSKLDDIVKGELMFNVIWE